MRHELLIDATDLDAWADRLEARERLPELVRRLVIRDSSVTSLSFPAAEGIQKPGFDGSVQAAMGNAFVPRGASVWELGSSVDLLRKANDDYTKRTRDPLGVNPAGNAFVFVTPRRWRGKDGWVRERQAEGIWREVKVLDADDLETWLTAEPAVHLWISELCGRAIPGLTTLERDAQEWRNVTVPPVNEALLLADREHAVERIRTWLARPASTLVVRESVAGEATAVLAAALAHGFDDGRSLWRSVVVRSLDAWRTLTASRRGPWILIPAFDQREQVEAACSDGHHVFFVQAPDRTVGRDVLELGRLGRDAAAKALRKMGVADLESLTTKAVRGMGPLRRALSRSGAGLTPAWAGLDRAHALVPALLAGRWLERDPDKAVLATLAGTTYEDYANEVYRLKMEVDPPLRWIEDTWYLLCADDAWDQVGERLTDTDLEHLRSALLSVTEPIVSWGLEHDDLRLLEILRTTPDLASSTLLSGLAESLARLGQGNRASWARGVVRTLLRRATSAGHWHALRPILRALAEAAPREFLDDITKRLRVARAPEEADEREVLSAEVVPWAALGIELVWALEALAWLPEHLDEATLALARLGALCSGGLRRVGSHVTIDPLQSLQTIFQIWFPNTASTFEARMTALDRLCATEPTIGWRVLCSLRPERMGAAFPIAKPRWRQCGAPTRITSAEHRRGVEAIVDRLLERVDDDRRRWADVIGMMRDFPQEQRLQAIGSLETMNIEGLDDEVIAGIAESLRALLSVQRRYPATSWSLPEEELGRLDALHARFEPHDQVYRVAWLFNSNPQLPEGRRSGDEGLTQQLDERRTQALTSLILSGPTAVITLIQAVECPTGIGLALLGNDLATHVDQQVVDELLEDADASTRDKGRAYLRGREAARGAGLVDSLRSSPDWTRRSTLARAAVLQALPFGPVAWDLAQREGEAVDRAYWQSLDMNWMLWELEDPAPAIRSWLRHGCSEAALEYLELHAWAKTRPATEVLDVLEAYAIGRYDREFPNGMYRRSLGLAQLLSAAADARPADPRVPWLEWFFLPVLHDARPASALCKVFNACPEAFVGLFGAEDGLFPDHRYKLLNKWVGLPGGGGEHAAFVSELGAWVSRVRVVAKEQRCKGTMDRILAQLLAHAPVGQDGVWPHEAVREVLETVESERLTSNFPTAVWNRQHRELARTDPENDRNIAAAYKSDSEHLSARYPRTARLLWELAEDYERDARRHEADVAREEHDDFG